MADNSQSSGNMAGQLITDPGNGKGADILEFPLRARIISALNSWLGIRVKVQQTDSNGNYIGTQDADVKMGPKGAVITLPVITTRGGSTPAPVINVVPYTFYFDGGDYIVGYSSQAVTTLSVGFGSGVTVTHVTVTSAIGIIPGMIMLGTGVLWFQGVVTTVVGNVVSFTSFVSSAASSGNYTFTAYANIAKPPKLRCSIASELYIDGTGVHTFTYTLVTFGGVNAAYTRLNTWNSGSNTQTEEITPAYLSGDIVYAITIPTITMPDSPGSGTTVAVSLLDIHDRDWAT